MRRGEASSAYRPPVPSPSRERGKGAFTGRRILATMSEPQLSNFQVFRRLTKMLRPQAAMIAVALVHLLLSMPGELIPGMTWMYVVDYLIRHDETNWTRFLNRFMSFGGRITGWKPLLV